VKHVHVYPVRSELRSPLAARPLVTLPDSQPILCATGCIHRHAYMSDPYAQTSPAAPSSTSSINMCGHTCSPAAYLASVSLKAESFMVVPILVFASTIFLRICRNLMVRASAWTPAPLLAGYIRHRGTELSMSLSCIPCMCLLPPLFTTALQTLKPILTSQRRPALSLPR
jgi:hypothetical protein